MNTKALRNVGTRSIPKVWGILWMANLGSRLLNDSACILLFQVLASVGKFCRLLVLMCSGSPGSVLYKCFVVVAILAYPSSPPTFSNVLYPWVLTDHYRLVLQRFFLHYFIWFLTGGTGVTGTCVGLGLISFYRNLYEIGGFDRCFSRLPSILPFHGL